MQINDTFRYANRDDARAAVEAAGLDLDDVTVLPHGDNWGWFTTDELGDDEISSDTVVTLGEDGPVITDSLAAHIEDAETSNLDELREAGVPLELLAGSNDEITSDRPEKDAEPGDVVLQLNGPMLPVAARLMGARLARRHGLRVTLRDAVTLEVKEIIEHQAGAKGAKGGKSPAPLVPTSDQEIILQLCSRGAGATSVELLDAGCHANMKKNTIPWKQFVKACERFGYQMRLGSRVVNDRAAVVYHLDAAPHANDSEVQAHTVAAE